MDILNTQFNSQNVRVETTFTGSGGTSANSETLALYMMALQKEEHVNQVQIAKVADQLINNNGYYGFGSTQATALALEALSDFYANNEKLYGSEKPVININGVEVQPNTSISSAFRAGDNTVNVSYPSGKGLPYKVEYSYYTPNAPQSTSLVLNLDTAVANKNPKVGETNRMTIKVKNNVDALLPMVTAKIGIPAGLTLQNSLLKDLIDKKQISYYEIFDNYLVLYWDHMDSNETKIINLDLKVEFAGEYTGKASNAYLFYIPENKFWNEGLNIKISN